MEFRRKHLLLIAFAILPFLSLIHFDDYCFGVADLLIIAGLTIVFFIAFIVMTFYDLYNLSIKKLRFNFIPLLIVAVFSISLFIGVKYQGKFLFKNQLHSFKDVSSEGNYIKIILFTNNSFELRVSTIEETCTQKGIYQLKNDSLFLNKGDKSFNDTIFDSIYYFNKKEKLLIPKSLGFSKITLEHSK
jgi:hypothetical protein